MPIAVVGDASNPGVRNAVRPRGFYRQLLEHLDAYLDAYLDADAT
jgi:hypothetical protein